jgi:outer membrane protein TolC
MFTAKAARARVEDDAENDAEDNLIAAHHAAEVATKAAHQRYMEAVRNGDDVLCVRADYDAAWSACVAARDADCVASNAYDGVIDADFSADAL